MKNRDTKIICTLGPASSSEEMLTRMASSGMDIARLNFSHGSYHQHSMMIDRIKKVNKKNGFNIKILQDLEGYRIRVGHFKKAKKLVEGQIVYMSNDEENEAEDHIPFDYEGALSLIAKGYDFYIDDGTIHLKVTARVGKRLKLKVVVGGLLKERKGINIPQLKLHADIITDKDKKDIEFGIKHNMDYIAQSFVRNKKDILNVKNLVSPYLPSCKIIAKIENKEGVRNIDSIIDACDGIMIARGDLGVTLPIYKIPMIQKYIIRRCNRKKKLVITATQMLESMTVQSRPSRAEVSDIANAILDGTDFVMLSGETAVGRYPCESIQMMSKIAEYTERCGDLRL